MPFWGIVALKGVQCDCSSGYGQHCMLYCPCHLGVCADWGWLQPDLWRPHSENFFVFCVNISTFIFISFLPLCSAGSYVAGSYSTVAESSSDWVKAQQEKTDHTAYVQARLRALGRQ